MEDWKKTNVGVFESEIQDCEQYMDDNIYNQEIQCKKCIKGKIITQNRKECVLTTYGCEYADNITKKCIKCEKNDDYYILNNNCVFRNQIFDGCQVREITKDECIQCSKLGFKLNLKKQCVKYNIVENLMVLTYVQNARLGFMFMGRKGNVMFYCLFVEK
ncbi:hypothetical protein IMG5_019000 [Ichthyophthirius multifiliis]|uniref:Uncharacterized protein n=1 Tax=Ichthyophthirius multifiliis TaxID=5932 RepID=G0QKK2_ICHMU|nr:hypothetical protein IMG5_019000 [Ichthyophthirius multifiliis]EGR34253.1 hypothetical protein IMG5_019000 [Ichthyophthirius multifiliis]|eukprot:XP_004039557.1 hypothetical protein IMG5_019000 [Ichthyophthirius multifiliis]